MVRKSHTNDLIKAAITEWKSFCVTFGRINRDFNSDSCLTWMIHLKNVVPDFVVRYLSTESKQLCFLSKIINGIYTKESAFHTTNKNRI